jgi:hypothetical protein
MTERSTVMQIVMNKRLEKRCIEPYTLARHVQSKVGLCIQAAILVPKESSSLKRASLKDLNSISSIKNERGKSRKPC